jgi:hypothetical protein
MHACMVNLPRSHRHSLHPTVALKREKSALGESVLFHFCQFLCVCLQIHVQLVSTTLFSGHGFLVTPHRSVPSAWPRRTHVLTRTSFPIMLLLLMGGGTCGHLEA